MMVTIKKRMRWMILFLPLVVGISLLTLAVSQLARAQGDSPEGAPVLQWSDDFESYEAGPGPEYFPSENWTPSAFAYTDTFVYNDQAVSGQQSLKMHGILWDEPTDECGGAVAYRNVGAWAPMEIEVWIRNGGNPLLYGCHKKYGGLELSTGPDWTYGHRGLLAFTYEEEFEHPYRIYGGGFELDEEEQMVYLADFQPDQWYKVNVVYDMVDTSTVTIDYHIEDAQGNVIVDEQQTLPAYGHELGLRYLGLWAGQGVVWHDDVSVWASGTPPIPLNERMMMPVITRP